MQRETRTVVESNRGGPLPESQRGRLKRAGETYGYPRVTKATGVALATYWRAIAGGTIYTSTAIAIQHGLDALEREAP